MQQVVLREHFDYSTGSTTREKALWQGLLRPTYRRKGAKPTRRHCIKDDVFIDPCCGSGGMFVQSADFVGYHAGNINNLSVFGQDANPTTRKMALMNLAIRGIEADLGAYNADTFYNDLHKTLKADFILANPPFNLSDWNDGSLNDDLRWKYGLPPSGNANFAWLQHMISHLSPNGKIGMVLANGLLPPRAAARVKFVRRLWGTTSWRASSPCPRNSSTPRRFPYRYGSSAVSNKAQKGKTLFIDARKMGTMVNRRLREMTAGDIAKVAATFQGFDAGTLEDVKGYCAAVTTAEIAKQEYILTPGRYVGIEEQQLRRQVH